MRIFSVIIVILFVLAQCAPDVYNRHFFSRASLADVNIAVLPAFFISYNEMGPSTQHLLDETFTRIDKILDDELAGSSISNFLRYQQVQERLAQFDATQKQAWIAYHTEKARQEQQIALNDSDSSDGNSDITSQNPPARRQKRSSKRKSRRRSRKKSKHKSKGKSKRKRASSKRSKRNSRTSQQDTGRTDLVVAKRESKTPEVEPPATLINPPPGSVDVSILRSQLSEVEGELERLSGKEDKETTKEEDSSSAAGLSGTASQAESSATDSASGQSKQPTERNDAQQFDIPDYTPFLHVLYQENATPFRIFSDQSREAVKQLLGTTTLMFVKIVYITSSTTNLTGARKVTSQNQEKYLDDYDFAPQRAPGLMLEVVDIQANRILWVGTIVNSDLTVTGSKIFSEEDLVELIDDLSDNGFWED